jgi:hypothetical protein
MQRENALDAFTVRDAAHSERLIKATAFAADHYAGKYLNAFLVTLHNARVNAYAVADRKRRQIGFLLFVLDEFNDPIHKAMQTARLRADTLIRGRRFCNSNSCGSGSSTGHENLEKLL